MLAFLPSIGFQEMFVLLVIGLLLYGRNLPEAGRTLGKAVNHLRRGLAEFKDQMDRDGDLREVKQSLKDSARELRNVAQVPGALANPTQVLADHVDTQVRTTFADLTDESLAAALPESLPESTQEPNRSDVTSSAGPS